VNNNIVIGSVLVVCVVGSAVLFRSAYRKIVQISTNKRFENE